MKIFRRKEKIKYRWYVVIIYFIMTENHCNSEERDVVYKK